MSQPNPIYDASDWPVVVVKMPDSRMSEQQFEIHLDACDAFYRRGSLFGIVFVMGKYPALSAAERKASADHLMAIDERYKHRNRAVAIVATSALERGVITAIVWLARPPQPAAAFANETEAKQWVRKHVVESAPRQQAG